jgi:hypothetical protein
MQSALFKHEDVSRVYLLHPVSQLLKLPQKQPHILSKFHLVFMSELLDRRFRLRRGIDFHLHWRLPKLFNPCLASDKLLDLFNCSTQLLHFLSDKLSLRHYKHVRLYWWVRLIFNLNKLVADLHFEDQAYSAQGCDSELVLISPIVLALAHGLNSFQLKIELTLTVNRLLNSV